MGLPTKKHTKTSKGDRRRHHGMKKIAVHIDEDGNAHLPHHASPASGKYRGKTVVNTQKRAARSARKAKA